MDEEDKQEVPPHFLETLRRIGAGALGMLQNRLELLIVELHEERFRLFDALLMVLAIVALGTCTLALAAAAVVVLLWKSCGILGLFILGGVCLVLTLVVCWRLYLRFKNWPLLAGTIEQLKKDRECLENK